MVRGIIAGIEYCLELGLFCPTLAMDRGDFTAPDRDTWGVSGAILYEGVQTGRWRHDPVCCLDRLCQLSDHRHCGIELK